ncbi:hypothetical protein EW146_g1720 [Bondarzewia mesenterica]|uniref:Velvet domain-containing protein n=1 Tax=Bondarzewia mesenterica TaxID=1095465 RepID=A0A4S4M4D6_9AGAM|nr:hypothetical protein EW146_g1720 [Bondarzewia mesenterica]
MSSSDSQKSPSSSQDPTEFLRNASFSRSEGPTALPESVSASDVLLGAYDPAKLHPLAGLGDQLDYLLLDDDKTSELPGSGTAVPSRGWSDDLCYGTGTMYLGGLALGGTWGLREGARRPLAVSNTRLRINSVLNAITRRGTFLGNSAGVLALAYNGINSTIDTIRGKHDTAGSMAAGALTGALYKSTAGVKPALAAATLMSGLAGGLRMFAAFLRVLSLANVSLNENTCDEKASCHMPLRDVDGQTECPPTTITRTSGKLSDRHALDWLSLFPSKLALSIYLILRLKGRLENFHHTLHHHSVQRDCCSNPTASTCRGHLILGLELELSPDNSPVRDHTFTGCYTTSNRPPSSRSTTIPYYTGSTSSGPSWGRQHSRSLDAASFSHYILPDVSIQQSPSPYGSDGDARTYHLEIIQQPETSAEFGSAALSRLPLSPPLIVQLVIRDFRGNVIEKPLEMPQDGHFPPNRLLYGNLVSSPHSLRNLQGRAGVYFLFPDVSVRQRGRYSLQVTLMRLSSTTATGMVRVGGSGAVLAQAWTRPFEIRPLTNYVAPRQTQLTDFFIQQGARMYAFASRSLRHNESLF